MILPLLSSVEIPVMLSDWPLSKALAPTTLSVTKALPPQLTLIMRSTVHLKSLAFTGCPFENTRPLRRVMV